MNCYIVLMLPLFILCIFIFSHVPSHPSFPIPSFTPIPSLDLFSLSTRAREGFYSWDVGDGMLQLVLAVDVHSDASSLTIRFNKFLLTTTLVSCS